MGGSDGGSDGRQQRAAQVVQRCRDTADAARKRSRETVVHVITSEKVIQAFLTGSVTGAVVAFFEGWSVLLSGYIEREAGFFIPAKWPLAVALVFVFYAAYWADQNTQRFREWVEEATDVDAAEDGEGVADE